MKKINSLASAVALAIALPGAAIAMDLEISGYLKNETAVYTQDKKATTTQPARDSGDMMKFENSARIFVNGEFGEESSWHADLNLIYDSEGVNNDYQGHATNTQNDWLRELYFDTAIGENLSLRVGKQQVVWGTADGIKLLDIMNPTDFRELNQNVMEDARIPVWMINAEMDVGDTGNMQFIIAEAQENKIAGLNSDGDDGHPFLFKGVDTITGATNGFVNIAQGMGKTSGVFQTLLGMGGLSGLANIQFDPNNMASGQMPVPMQFTTVSQFTALNPSATWPNKTFSQVGQGLTMAGTAGVVGNIDLTTGAPTTAAIGTAGTALQFQGPLATDTTNTALLNAVFLPMMNQYQNGNNVLFAASHGAGNLLGTASTGFIGYMSGLQGALDPATGNALNGIKFDPTTGAMTYTNTTPDIDKDTIKTALDELGRQMTVAVSNGMVAAGNSAAALTNPNNLNDAANATAMGAMMAALGATTQQEFQQKIQEQAIAGMGQSFFSNSTINQFTAGTLNTTNPTSAFDYMGDTTFGTFTNFIGMKTVYRNKHEDETDANFGFRFKNSTEGGTGYSFNIAHRKDANPYVDMHWEDSAGNKLNVNKIVTSMDGLGQPRLDMDGSGAIGDAANENPNGEAYKVTTLSLQNSNGSTFNSQTGPATLVFEEKLNDVTTVGFSFDTAIDSAAVPIILRGEFSYDIGAKQPVIDKTELSIGNLTEALKMEDGDMFKYVLGLDITVLSNLLVSTQLIQFHNLDYVDSGSRYTGDFSSMHLTNGLKKGDEIETFVSLFLSKPFGDSQEHRWNNMIISENDGGYWNRFDVEYAFTDTIIGSFEYNKYWGDENTTFGQFEKSSNVQLGLKWIIE